MLFTSEYNSHLFYKFVTHYIQDITINPWEAYFSSRLPEDSFPYHALMLYILTPFAYLAQLVKFEPLFKFPLLIADMLNLLLFFRMFPFREKKVILYYHLNPIVIYSTYIHSQLDIIPTSFLLYAIYLISQKKYYLSALIYSFGLATKSHILVALPLLLFYIYKKTNIQNSFKSLLIIGTVAFIIDSPYIFSEGFIHMVLLNQKQMLLYDTFFYISDFKFFFPIASILAVYLHFFNQVKVNNDLLYFYFGLLFTVTIFFINPYPAWYMWMIPFVIIYFIQSKDEKKAFFLHATLSVSYLIFFIFFYKSEYIDIIFFNSPVDFKIDNNKLQNIFFTFLEVLLLAIMYTFYKYGIKSNSIYKKMTNLVIGIGGDSGVGKSTLVKNMGFLLGEKIVILEGDGEHKWERGDINWKRFTHLDPKANFIHRQFEVIYALKHNHSVYRRDYDHSTGKFTNPIKVQPKEFIVIAGLHPFYLPKLRKIIDLKIYLDTDEDLRQHWKILRDTKIRGYSIEKILQQIEHRKVDAKKYIHPQKTFADIVIQYFAIDNFVVGQETENIRIGVQITLDANINIEPIVEKLECDYEWDFNIDLKTQYIKLLSVPTNDFAHLAHDIIENIQEITSHNQIWLKGCAGFVQLIILLMISEKLKTREDEI